jgi:hypothetical protein
MEYVLVVHCFPSNDAINCYCIMLPSNGDPLVSIVLRYYTMLAIMPIPQTATLQLY